MSSAEQIRGFVRYSMAKEMYSRSGAVMLSGTDAFRLGCVYIMGLNPGGDPKALGHRTTIIDSVQERPGFSCYTDECWQPKCTAPIGECVHLESGRVRPDFLVKHQRNILTIAKALRLEIADIFSANAVFARSTSLATMKDQSGYSLAEWWESCWPVHQRFLAIVRPKIIITLGYGATSSAFGLLHEEAGHPEWRRMGDESRRGGWALDAALPLSDGGALDCTVVGVPHPSFMAIGPNLAESLRDLATT